MRLLKTDPDGFTRGHLAKTRWWELPGKVRGWRSACASLKLECTLQKAIATCAAVVLRELRGTAAVHRSGHCIAECCAYPLWCHRQPCGTRCNTLGHSLSLCNCLPFMMLHRRSCCFCFCYFCCCCRCLTRCVRWLSCSPSWCCKPPPAAPTKSKTARRPAWTVAAASVKHATPSRPASSTRTAAVAAA